MSFLYVKPIAYITVMCFRRNNSHDWLKKMSGVGKHAKNLKMPAKMPACLSAYPSAFCEKWNCMSNFLNSYPVFNGVSVFFWIIAWLASFSS